MKKILFMFGMYKPRMSPNGICCEQVMKKCKENGFEVWCIVNKERNSKNNEIIEGINIYRIKTRLSYRLVEYYENNKNKLLAKMANKIARILEKIKLVFYFHFWPLQSVLYAYRYYKKAKELHKKEKFDVVVGIYTPIEALIGAHLLKKKFKDIKFFAYFLDSLSGGQGLKIMSMKSIIKRGKKWERKLMSNANKVMVMEASKKHHMNNNRDSSFYKNIVFLDIPLLEQKEKKVEQHLVTTKGVNIVFTGMLKYPMRDPHYIITLIDKIREKCRYPIYLYFIGDNNCNKLLEKEKKNKSWISICDKVERDIAISIMYDASILLNLATKNNSSQIPSKIIDYISCGKPIISTYNFDEDPSNTYLENYPYAILLDERNKIDENIQKEVIDFINNVSFTNVEFSKVKENFYKNTPDAFVDEIKRELRS